MRPSIRLTGLRAEARSQRYGIAIGAIALLVAAGVPAHAVEGATSAATSVAKALKIAKKADKRSTKALRLARKNKGRPGVQGPMGPQGPPGAQGAVGSQGPPGPATGAAGGDLAGQYPDPEIAPDAVTGAEVDDGSLNGADVAGLTGTDVVDGSLALADISPNFFAVPRNPPSMASGTCVNEVSAGPSVQEGDRVLLTPSSTLPNGFAAYGMIATAGNAPFRICNFSGATVDPPAMTLSLILLR